MRILIIGAGGREHALAWKLSQSDKIKEIHIAPGNGGTLPWKNVQIAAGAIPALKEYIKTQKINFVIPGPELPLVNGITDACKEIGVPCFGPDKFCAQLEGSKIFAKEMMRESNVPTASYSIAHSYDEALKYIEKHGAPIVIKADGLAAGKGVVVAATLEEAKVAIDEMFNQKSLGSAAERVLLEETLIGEEVSLLAFCDGERATPLPSAQDHKRAFDNDQGPNTGGMGAYSPAPLLPDEKIREACDLTITPILKTMKAKGHPFVGILYAGIMFTDKGPMVLEYNTRFGDPECQPLLMRLEGDLFDIMDACTKGELDKIKVECSDKHAVCVVIAAKGYPADYPKGMEITNLDQAEEISQGNVKVFQAGTKTVNGKIVSDGGRVLGVTALGSDLKEAAQTAYLAVDRVKMDKAHYRTDIAAKGLKRS